MTGLARLLLERHPLRGAELGGDIARQIYIVGVEHHDRSARCQVEATEIHPDDVGGRGQLEEVAPVGQVAGGTYSAL